MKRLVEIDDATHVVVPRVATDAMLARVGEKGGTTARAYAYAAWDDMLAAAPTLPDTERAAPEALKLAIGYLGLMGEHGKVRAVAEEWRAEKGLPLPDAQAVTDERAAFEGWIERYRKGKPYWSNARVEICRDTWNARAALSAAAVDQERCQYCDGTGDVHDQTGEWRGECTECDANDALNAKRLRVLMRRSLVIPAFIRIADGIIGAEAREAAIAAASKGEWS